VLVMREQRIALEDQVAFGSRFGPLSVHPFSPNLEDKPEVIVLDYSADHPAARTDVWHADETFRANPPMATCLRARVVPANGGDTCFASMTAAYRGLSERMKRHIHGLEALHDFKPFRSLFNNTPAHRKRLRELEDEFPNPWHPVVRMHPVSGRRAIYVNPQFTMRIRDVKEDESSALLAYLYAQAAVPEYQLRVKWQVDTVVIWDNRSVQHYAPHDYYPQRRSMERVTITGDVPVGVSGPYEPETVEGLGVVNPTEPPRKAPVRQFERTR
jgi:taurine dioxygenase